ncbi:hypothetical protein [Haloplanus salilacus]|uniref:hypothetical protein n=1 Tax=Haloplanus salilacus TaxID=2949994 RepID=UPI0030D61F11
MRRGTHAIVVVLVLFGAGCAGLAPEATPTPSPQATETPTATPPPTTTPDPVGVEYVVRAGTVPDDVESVTVTFQVVFVERRDDMGPCWRETFSGPYKPTVTPIRPPSGDCHRSAPITLGLTEVDGERSLDRVTAPGRFDAGHALVVTNVTATYENRTAVRGMRIDERASVVEGSPAGPYRVRLSVASYLDDDRPYDYWFVAEREG